MSHTVIVTGNAYIKHLNFTIVQTVLYGLAKTGALQMVAIIHGEIQVFA